ncbi:hypothetical protein MUU48_13840 [Scandinavium sp. H11S7]|uniref:hypothetical protein n=1 Tax=Scandinavium hiltneri TaxID=2926519 RepID=UPI0021654F79|nr:hypothetical protein [Scandinavium hiltneri]MCS2157986.1 hypothetical protein [Scandinavium hiltneri]
MKLSQQLLTHMAAKQKPKSLMLGWSEEAGIELGLNNRFNEMMKIKKSALIMLSIVVRWLGLGLGGTGMVWGGWFLFFSYDNYRFAWGLYFLLQTYVGFLIFRYGMKK